MSDPQPDAAASASQGSRAFRSRALVAYLLILSSFGLAVGFLLWNLHRHMEEGHRYRLLELRRASENLEELFEINLKNVANVYRSQSGQDIEVNEDWVEEITDRQPFLTFQRITGKIGSEGCTQKAEEQAATETTSGIGQSAGAGAPETGSGPSALCLDSRSGSLRVEPPLELDRVKNPTPKLGPSAFRHGIQGETLCLEKGERRPSTCSTTREGGLEDGDRIHHQWQVRAPVPEGLRGQAPTLADLDLRQGRLGFWVADSKELPAGSLLDRRLRSLLEKLAGEGVAHGLELPGESTFSGDEPLPPSLRLWIEAPTPAVPTPSKGAESAAAVGHLLADEEYVSTVRFPELPEGVGFSAVSLVERGFGNWSLQTDRGQIELDKRHGKELDTRYGADYADFRIRICERDLPCYSGRSLVGLQGLAESLGWEHDPIRDASFVDGGSRIRLIFRPTKIAINALAGGDQISLVDAQTVRVHGQNAFVPLELGPEANRPELRLSELMHHQKALGGTDFEVASTATEIVLAYHHSYPAVLPASICSGGSAGVGSVSLDWHESESRAGWSVPGLEVRCETEAWARFSFDLEAMLEAAVELEDFDQWALFDDQGHGVLARDHAPGPFRLDAPDVWTTLAEARVAEAGASGGKGKGGSGLGDSIGLFQQELSVAGVEARLSCQSFSVATEVRLPDVLFEMPEKWHLCGLVDGRRARQEAIGLDPSRTAGAVLLALLLIGVLVYAKPSLMAPQERLGRLDLILLTSSTVLLLGLLAIGNLAVFRGLGAGAELDQQLRRLALDVQRELGSDLVRYAREVANLDDLRCTSCTSCAGLWADDERSATAEKSGTPTESTSADGAGAPRVVREVLIFSGDADSGPMRPDSCRLGGFLLPETPPFSSIFWVDSDGRQIHKATSRSQNTPAVSVGDRAYFVEAREGNGLVAEYLPPPGLPPSDRDLAPFYFETNRSKTTGEPFFALSRRSSCADAGALESADVVALTGKLPSMEALVTPPFDFAVVDAGGRVILASHPRLEIRDRLIEEVRESERLAKALTLEAPVHLEVSLGNRSYRAHSRPLFEAGAWHGMAPLRVVTFYERELARTVIAEAVLIAAVLLLIYLSVVFLVAVFLRRQLHHLFWPKPVGTSGYGWEVLILMLYAIVGVLYWASREAVEIGSLVHVMLLAGFGALLYFAWRHSNVGPLQQLPLLVKIFGEAEPKANSRPARRQLELMAGLLGILIGIVPGLFFFDLAWQFQLRSIESQAESWWSAAESRREERLSAEWSSAALGDRYRSLLETTSDRFHLPLLPLPGTTLPASSVSPESTSSTVGSGRTESSGFLGFLSDSLPIYNRTSEKIRYQWRALNEGTPLPATWPMALMASLISMGMALWMLSVRRRLEIRVGSEPPIADLDALLAVRHELAEPRLVILTSGDQWDRVDSLGDVDRVDLATAPSVDEKGEKPLFISGLAQALAEPSLRESTLKYLAATMNRAPERPLWIFTSTDPYRLLEEAVAEGGGRRESGAILDFGDAFRWVHLLGRFRRVFTPIDAKALGAIPDDRKEDIFWPMLWCCSDAERLAMLHLACEGMVNPKQSAAVEGLVWRGLLTQADPKRPIAFFSKRFRKFVFEHAATGRLLALEREAGKKGWRSLRMVFVTLLTILFCFLFFLDNELLESLVGLLTGLAAILPLGLGLLSRFGESS